VDLPRSAAEIHVVTSHIKTRKEDNIMRRVIFILALATASLALVIGCGQDRPTTPVNALSTVSIASVNGVAFEYCTDLLAGQTTNVGDVCAEVIDNGESELLCITYTTTDGWELIETHTWLGEYLTDMPQTRKGNPIPGQFPDNSGDISGSTTYTACFDLNQFGTEGGTVNLCNKLLYAAAHAAVGRDTDGDGVYDQTETAWGDGDRMVDRGNWATRFTIQLTCGGGGQLTGQTAFAYGCDDATCFLDLTDEDGSGFHRWGWSNGPLGMGTYYFDIYAGAGQCDLSKGTLVGLLTVDYDGSTATVTYNTCGTYTMDEVHLYVGNEMLARDVNGEYTVAPGQYPYIDDDIATNTYTFTVDGLSGEIYVVAHAVVVGDYSQGSCGTPGCVPPTPPCNEWIVYGANLNAGSDPLDDAIYAYDLNAQTRTLVYDPTPVDASQNYPNGYGYDPVEKRIYMGTDDGRFFYYDIDDNVFQQLTVNVNFGTMACGSWYNGKFYYVQNGTNRLYEVVVAGTNATRTQIGTVPTSNGYGDIAFDPAHPGVFLASAGNYWYWYNVNDNTMSGNLTLLGDNPGNHLQLAYGSNGVLYGVEATSGVWYTVTYDATTVTNTLFGWTSPYTYTDLASGPQCQ
jgi:hypothetical protein